MYTYLCRIRTSCEIPNFRSKNPTRCKSLHVNFSSSWIYFQSYIPPENGVYLCNGINSSLDWIGENCQTGWESKRFRVWWPGKNYVYVYVSIFKNNVSPLHGKFVCTLFKYSSRYILSWWWYLMCFAELEAAVVNAGTSSGCVNARGCTKSCLLVAFGLAWMTAIPCTMAVLLFSSSVFHALKWGIKTNTVANAALF